MARLLISRFAVGLVIGVSVAALVAALAVGSTPVRIIGAVVLVVCAVLVIHWWRKPRDRSLKLEIDGDSLEVPDLPPEDQQRLADAWTQRYGPSDGDESPLPPPAPKRASPPLSAPPAAAREVPYWLQVASPLVGMITGVGGIIIAILK